METVRQTPKESKTSSCGPRASIDNRRSHPLSGRSLFPENATARIFKPSRSVATSATAQTKEWRLVFERCSAPFIEPLLGYTGSGETLVQVELKFPTLESAIRYAERQGLDYLLQRQTGTGADRAAHRKWSERSSPASADAMPECSDPAAVQQGREAPWERAALTAQLSPRLRLSPRVTISKVCGDGKSHSGAAAVSYPQEAVR
ncbi:NADH dehydrogenase ubiquinone Fe-S protein [Rhizobium phaseoli]|uniref:Hypothetical conserved protein n=1 Tax=Rhizobium etli (strain CIAT 652) TaxID=491916 RepID=B3PU10_RHIE6|nr:NADH dehydrogenase ubiquinone Fe-S protein 4 [Rhizobium phaseoli]ACE90314.1 hypothetical conserved protein [Rhizobium etli CIAT 652]ANL27124.1 NADH dehydrogenase ubiquinone Fe-S protein [Rhizobium phaseoli]PCD65149.1 hypothetical protein CO648_24465 [Rhizobium phaseoli]